MSGVVRSFSRSLIAVAVWSCRHGVGAVERQRTDGGARSIRADAGGAGRSDDGRVPPTSSRWLLRQRRAARFGRLQRAATQAHETDPDEPDRGGDDRGRPPSPARASCVSRARTIVRSPSVRSRSSVTRSLTWSVDPTLTAAGRRHRGVPPRRHRRRAAVVARRFDHVRRDDPGPQHGNVRRRERRRGLHVHAYLRRRAHRRHPECRRLEPGATWEQTVQVEVPSLTFGDVEWNATASGFGPPVSATDTTSSVSGAVGAARPGPGRGSPGAAVARLLARARRRAGASGPDPARQSVHRRPGSGCSRVRRHRFDSTGNLNSSDDHSRRPASASSRAEPADRVGPFRIPHATHC